MVNKILKIFFLVSCLLYCNTILLKSLFSKSNEWLLSSSDQTSISLPQITDIETSNHTLNFKVNVPGLTGSQITYKDTTYYGLKISGCLPTDSIGKPMVPRLIKCIAIPASCRLENIKIQANSDEFYNIVEYEIAPVPKQSKRKISDGVVYIEEEYLKDKVSYSSNRFYPKELIRVEKIGYIRDQKVMWLSINPLQYNPVSKTLKTHSAINVHLTFNGDVINEQISLGPFDSLKKELFLNYKLSPENIGTSPTNSGTVSYPENLLYQNNEADYLIITTDDLITDASLDSFAEHKANFNGFNVAVVKCSDIYQQFPKNTQDASIKEFLRYAFYHWQAPFLSDNHFGYVLLIGEGNKYSTNSIPSHHLDISEPSSCSDHWYTCVNDDNGDGKVGTQDNIADFIIGRFSVETHSELAAVTQKTINYENELLIENSWRQKISLVSGFVGLQDSSVISLFDDLEKMTKEQDYYKIDLRLHRSEMNKYFVRNSFVQQINDGCAIFNVCAHGNVDGWGDANGWALFRKNDIDSLTNRYKQAIIFSFACLTGDFCNSSQDCLGEELLASSNGGAVAFWGASDEVLLSGNNYICEIINENILNSQYGSIGLILYLANFLNNSYYSSSLASYNLLGDPSLSFREKTKSFVWDTTAVFMDIASAINVADTAASQAAAFADYNDDGYLDIFLSSWPEADALFRNNGDNLFDKITLHPDKDNPYLKHYDYIPTRTNFVDYDNDGDLDIYLYKEYCYKSQNRPGDFYCAKKINLIYRNDGNDLFPIVHLITDKGEIITEQILGFFDYDLDGLLDIICSNIEDDKTILYKKNTNGSYSDVTSKAGLSDIISGTSVSFGDYNNDGYLDFYLNTSEEIPNILFKNIANKYYIEATSSAGIESLSGYVSFCDFFNFGYLYIYEKTSRSVTLYRNRGTGKFAKLSTKVGSGSIGKCWVFDYDNDGYDDIFINDNDNLIYRNRGFSLFSMIAGAFKENWTWDYWGFGGFTVGDYDSDGDLDIYNAVSQKSNVLYTNKGNNNNWLVINLKGFKNNSFGIGSRVRVVTDNMTQIKDMTCEINDNQNSLPLEFGLGSHTNVDSVVVFWPNGIKDVLTDIDVVNQRITIKEGSGDYSVTRDYKYQLTQNFPNPFNENTQFLYTVKGAADSPESSAEVIVRIYNLLGQKVNEQNLGIKKPGQYLFRWSGLSDENRLLPSGVYFYQLKAGEFVQTKKMVLLR